MSAEAPPGLVAGRILARAGGAPARAVVTLIDSRGRQAGQARPGADGAFRLPAPGAGDFVLLASAPGHHPVAVALRLPADAAPHEFVLDRLVAQVEGLVRAFPSGAPVAGALVVATDETGSVRDTARSDGTGRYALGGLAAGQHTVTASADGMWPAAMNVTVPGSTRSVACDVDMLEPLEVAGRTPGERWSAAKQEAARPDDGFGREDFTQPAAGSTSPATSASTSPVWPARTARPPSTTT